MIYQPLLALAALPVTFAAPRPQTGLIIPPTEARYCAVVDSHEEANGPSWQLGRSVDGGEPVVVETSHSVGITWEVGGEIGISGGSVVEFAGGLGFSVAEQVTDATAESSQKDCPEGPWHCSAVMYPWGFKLKGHMHQQSADEGCDNESFGSFTHDITDGQTWEVWVPKKDDSGNGFATLEACTCKNMEHWADDGHVALICPEDCAKGADN